MYLNLIITFMPPTTTTSATNVEKWLLFIVQVV